MILKLKSEYTRSDLPWHTEDRSSTGVLCEIGLSRGNFPEESKSILLKFCARSNLVLASTHGSGYLRGLADEKLIETFWIKEKMETKEEAVDSMSKILPRVP